jgi:hypothetical protein
MPRLRENEQMIGFRPRGHTSLQTKTQNYNFELQRENHQNSKYKSIIFIVLCTFIPFTIFIMNAEGNFRKTKVKEFASKRRERLDKEHGINREEMTQDWIALDRNYRLTEKEEIKKYSEIGKTPQQYYDEQKSIGRLPGGGKSDDIVAKPSIDLIKETFLKKEDGLQVKHFQGEGYDQIEVSSANEGVPDPRIGGTSITFDSRLDSIGSRRPQIRETNDAAPVYRSPQKQDLSLKSPGKNADALYEKQDHPYDRLCSLRSYYIDQTVIRYNMITRFLNSFGSKSEQEFAAYLIQ